MKKAKMSRKTRLPLSSIILYTAAAIIFLCAIAAVVNNIILFKDNVEHYVNQGYAYAEVFKGLFPSQLLPGIFEPVASYMGIALVLFGAALINQKVSQLVKLAGGIKPENLNTTEMRTDEQEETSEEEVIENTGAAEKNVNETETAEKDNKVTD
jgi:Sec-independent protein translocase protein TatA